MPTIGIDAWTLVRIAFALPSADAGPWPLSGGLVAAFLVAAADAAVNALH